MRRLILSAVLLCAISGTLWHAATPVGACTCGPFSSEQAALRADVVVVGTITVAATQTGNPRASLDCAKADGQSGAISVERYLKGSGSRQRTFDNAAPSYCATKVNIGERYAMFLYGQPGTYAADAVDLCKTCSDDPKLMTIERSLAGITTPMTVSEKGSPEAQQFYTESAGGTNWLVIISVVAIPVALFAAAAVVWPRRRT